jgi:formylglycine-generating enzyme required for sulfatase activity
VNLANFNSNIGDTTKVGSYPSGASPYGALDMAGNVWEWVSDWYSATFYQTSPSSNPVGPSSGDYRVLRGGSWGNVDGNVRSAFRDGYTSANWASYIGFRCAASP